MSRSRKLICTFALLLGGSLLGAPGAFASCPDANTPAPLITSDQLEVSITCLINEQRTSRGIGAVTENDDLAAAADGHSREMVDRGYFDHTSPAGSTFVDRIQNAGYLSGVRTWTVGENLAWGTGPLSSAQSLVTSWMNSPPHRQNLLNPDFRELGVGAVSGTPLSSRDITGFTVSSEYGSRTVAKHKAKGKARKSRKALKRHR